MSFTDPPLEVSTVSRRVYGINRARRVSLTPFKLLIVQSWDSKEPMKLRVYSEKEAGDMIRRFYQASDRLNHQPALGVACSKIYILDDEAIKATTYRSLPPEDKDRAQIYVGFCAKLRSFRPRAAGMHNSDIRQQAPVNVDED